MIFLIILIIFVINLVAIYDLAHLYDNVLRINTGFGLREYTRRRNIGHQSSMPSLNDLHFTTPQRIRSTIDTICCFPVLAFAFLLGFALKPFLPDGAYGGK